VIQITIPVQIDSIKQMDDFQQTRCVYYRLEKTNGPVGWPLGANVTNMHIWTWGDWGVLTGPDFTAEGASYFDSKESIIKTIDRVESIEDMCIEQGYIWIPNELILSRMSKAKVRVGDIFRMSETLFRDCYRYTADMISESEWLESCEAHSDGISYSSKETEVFRQWRKEQVGLFKERHHDKAYKHRQLPKLKPREESQ
jgi:hypothetical protein